jgi:exopolysaccharide production protein ExoZ
MTKNQPLLNIQRLRAIAATLVVTYHTIGNAEKYSVGVGWLDLLQPWGTTGVDIFFVISGFIMVHIQRDKTTSPLVFLLERLVRIAPLYWLLTSTLLLLFLIAPSIFNNQHMGANWIASSYAFISQANTGKMPLLYDGWTLEYEMFFYLVFAITLYTRNIKSAIAISAGVMTLFSWLTGNSIVMEFVLGMFLGFLKQHRNKPPLNPWLALIIGLVGLYLSGAASMQGNETRAWAVGIPSVLLVYGSIYIKQWPIGPLSKWGDASYSIYLMQVFTISAWYKLATKLNTQEWGFMLAVGCIVATTVTGIITHHVVEKPLTRLLSPLKNKLRHRILA